MGMSPAPSSSPPDSGAPPIVIATSACYQALLCLCPNELRANYGREMELLFRQCCRDAYETRGVLGVVAMWLPMLRDVLWGALSEHMSGLAQGVKESLRMNRVRTSLIVVFCAYIVFIIAGMSYNQMIEDDLRNLNGPHPAIAAAYYVVAVSALVALLAMLAGGLPIAGSVALRAWRDRHWGTLALFGVPPLSLAIWLGWTWAILNVIRPENGHFTPRQHTGMLFILSWIGVFGLAAVASTAAVAAAIARSDIDTRLWRFSRVPATVVTLAMAVMFGAVLAWGLLVHAEIPDYLSRWTGPFGTSIAVSWIAHVIVMALATIIAAIALTRAFRAPDAPLGAAMRMRAA